jgi:hypothetical protein
MYEQGLKLYGGLMCYSLRMQKGSYAKGDTYEDLFILYFEIES